MNDFLLYKKKQDINGQTPIHICAMHGQVSKVRALLERGAEINVVDGKGNTPLHLAARNGHELFVLELLGRNADPLS